jgi:mannose-6-phosphate isomerase-like protein (cupin superfamily)
MHYVGPFDESKFVVPFGYGGHSKGYERVPLVDHSIGSVHMGLGICQLRPKGLVEICITANEKGLYVLGGEVEVNRDGKTFRLSADDYALIPYGIPHAFRNTGEQACRWLEMQAPQPRPPHEWQDLFFTGEAEWPEKAMSLDLQDPRTRQLGHFARQMPLSYEGVAISGLTVYWFMGPPLGAQQFLMMRGELAAGGVCGLHDHPLEESYFVLNGEADVKIEGKKYHLQPGNIMWTGVGASHGFFQTGKAPFCWIETQSPQFPLQNGIRNYALWAKLQKAYPL